MFPWCQTVAGPQPARWDERRLPRGHVHHGPWPDRGCRQDAVTQHAGWNQQTEGRALPQSPVCCCQGCWRACFGKTSQFREWWCALCGGRKPNWLHSSIVQALFCAEHQLQVVLKRVAFGQGFFDMDIGKVSEKLVLEEVWEEGDSHQGGYWSGFYCVSVFKCAIQGFTVSLYSKGAIQGFTVSLYSHVLFRVLLCLFIQMCYSGFYCVSVFTCAIQGDSH